MSLDLNKLENKLDEALSNETSETLNNWLNDKRMINNKQQTAVDWLWEIAYNRELTVEDWKQAKEMEREQHVQIWNDSLEEVLKKLESLKQYYNSNQRRR